MKFNAKSAPTGFSRVRREERGFESGLYHTGKHSLWAVSVILIFGHSRSTPWSLAGSVTWQLRMAQWTPSTTETLLPIRTCSHSGRSGKKIQLLGRFALSQSIPQCIWERRWNEGCATAGWMHHPKNEDQQKYPNTHSCWALCLRTCAKFYFPIIFTNEFHDQKGNVYKMWVRSAWAGQ